MNREDVLYLEHVALVVDRSFRGIETALEEHEHVWLIETAANRATAERVWSEAKSHGAASWEATGATVFQSPPSLSPAAAIEDILDTVLEHHPGTQVLTVYGVDDRVSVERAVANVGFAVRETRADRIVCERVSA